MSNNSNNKKNNKKNNKQKQQKFQEETPDEGSNHQRGRTEEESNPNEMSDKTISRLTNRHPPSQTNKSSKEESDLNETINKTNKSTSKSSPTKSNKQKQQRFQEETPDEGSNRQWGKMEEESNLNETSDKTNKSTSKSPPTKSNKQKQQRFQEETPSKGSNRQRGRAEEESDLNETIDKTNKSTSKSSPTKSNKQKQQSKSSPTKSNKQKQQRFQEETPDEGSNRQWGKMEEESNLNETSDKTNKSTSKSPPTKSNKQKQQRFQEETPSKGSNRQRGRAEEESDLNETIDKTNKSTSKSSPTKSNKQKQQRFQEETPDEGSNRQRGRTEEESNPNEMIDKTNKSTSKSSPIKSILKSAKSTKPTQEESDDEVIEIEPPNIPKNQQEMLSEMKKRYGNIRIPQKFVLVVKDDQGNERMIDDDDTDLEADENDDLHESLNRYSRICLPKAIHRQTDLKQPAKRQKRIKSKKSERYKEESEEERSGSNNNDEYNEKEARAEMKSILKTINETRGLDYNETFNSAKNLKIRHKLVPELHSALAPCFPASNKQLTKWLGCLHKSRRSHQRLMDRGKADENKHQMHSNNRVHDVKISETDEEDPTKSIIAIYDYSWRSDESKLIRERRYDDEVQKYDRPHPSNAPEWSYIVQQQDLIFDTDIDQGLITEYDEEEEKVSRGTTPATGNTTENDEDHNKEGEEKPSKSTNKITAIRHPISSRFGLFRPVKSTDRGRERSSEKTDRNISKSTDRVRGRSSEKTDRNSSIDESSERNSSLGSDESHGRSGGSSKRGNNRRGKKSNRNQSRRPRRKSRSQSRRSRKNELSEIHSKVDYLIKEIHDIKKVQVEQAARLDNHMAVAVNRDESAFPEPNIRKQCRVLEAMSEEQYKLFRDEIVQILAGLDSSLSLDHTQPWNEIQSYVSKDIMPAIDKALKDRIVYNQTELKYVLQRLHHYRRKS
ncbi:unnamed protein product [Rhizophagus irregularis]|nr:unnamed protein product [Rhizophagus irregularis]